MITTDIEITKKHDACQPDYKSSGYTCKHPTRCDILPLLHCILSSIFRARLPLKVTNKIQSAYFALTVIFRTI